MTFLGRTLFFTTKHRTVSYWSSKLYFSNARVSSYGDIDEIGGDNEKHVSNTVFSEQNTFWQPVAHDQKRRKFAVDISKGPGLKDFVTNSFVPPVTRESVPYVRNASVNGLNRKGMCNCSVTLIWCKSQQ